MLEGAYLDRKEAMALLRELMNNGLVEPSWVSVSERHPQDYQLQLKCDYNKAEIETYAKRKQLTIEEDPERKYLVIFKP